MDDQEQKIKSVVRQKLESMGGSTATLTYFENLPTEQKEIFESSLDKTKAGAPVIISINGNHWTVVGTKSISWNENDTIQYLSYDLIDQIRHNEEDRERVNKLSVDRMHKKFEHEALEIIDKYENRHILRPVKGYDFFVLWHILLKVKKNLKVEF